MLKAKPLRITCLCMLSFLLNEFSQTEQNQLMSTSQEQNVDWEKGRILRIYIGLLLLLLLLLHHHHHISMFSFTTTTTAFLFFCFTTTTTFLFFPPSDSIKDRKLPQLVQFVSMSQVVKNNRGFLQLLAFCPDHQRHFLFRTATPQQLHGLVQVLYNVLKECIRMPEENKLNVFSCRCSSKLSRNKCPLRNKKVNPCTRGWWFYSRPSGPCCYKGFWCYKYR